MSGGYSPAPMITATDFEVEWKAIKHLAIAPELVAYVETLINALGASERREAHTWSMYVQAKGALLGDDLPPGSPFARK